MYNHKKVRSLASTLQRLNKQTFALILDKGISVAQLLQEVFTQKLGKGRSLELLQLLHHPFLQLQKLRVV